MTGHLKVRDQGSEIRVYPGHVYTIGAQNTRIVHHMHGMYHTNGILQMLIMC